MGDGEKQEKLVADVESVSAVGSEAAQKVEHAPEVDSIVIEKISERTNDISSQADAPDSPVRYLEKKRLNWDGKTCAYRSVTKIYLTHSYQTWLLLLPSAILYALHYI